MLKMELPAKMKRGRRQRRFANVVREEMHRVSVRKQYARDRVSWR